MKQTTLGSYIRTLRTQNHMTQAQLADKIGVTDKAVSKWERDLSYPDITLFPKLANILGVTVNDIFTECIDGGKPSGLLQIYEISHDIRTPLHIILGCAEMAKNHSDNKEMLMRYLDSISISGEYLLKAFDNILPGADLKKTDNKKSYPSNINELGEYLDEHNDTPKEASNAFTFTGKRFLVAEDIGLIREISVELLKQTGAEVEYAEDGRICLDKIESSPAGYYDLILMDIMMPNMDGLEATRRIRSLPDPVKASIPIIAVSANVHEKEKHEAMKAGMNAFTEKPIFIENLISTIKQFVKNK